MNNNMDDLFVDEQIHSNAVIANITNNSSSIASSAIVQSKHRYRDYFWGDKISGYEVLNSNLRHIQKTVREFETFLKETAASEEQYIKQMNKTTSIINKFQSNSSFAPVWSGVLKELNERHSWSHLHYMNRISELIKELQSYYNETKKKKYRIRESELKTKQTVDSFKSIKSQLSKSKEHYHSVSLELQKQRQLHEASKQQLTQNASTSSSSLSSQAAVIVKLEKKCNQALEEYQSSIQKFNAIRNDYERRFADSCSIFQIHEEAHLVQMQKFSMELFNITAQLNQNRLKCFGEVQQKFAETYTIDYLIEQFIGSKSTGVERPPSAEFVEAPILNSNNSVEYMRRNSLSNPLSFNSRLSLIESNENNGILQKQVSTTTSLGSPSTYNANLSLATSSGVISGLVGPAISTDSHLKMQASTPTSAPIDSTQADYFSGNLANNGYLNSASLSEFADDPAAAAAAANSSFKRQNDSVQKSSFKVLDFFSKSKKNASTQSMTTPTRSKKLTTITTATTTPATSMASSPVAIKQKNKPKMKPASSSISFTPNLNLDIEHANKINSNGNWNVNSDLLAEQNQAQTPQQVLAVVNNSFEKSLTQLKGLESKLKKKTEMKSKRGESAELADENERHQRAAQAKRLIRLASYPNKSPNSVEDDELFPDDLDLDINNNVVNDASKVSNSSAKKIDDGDMNNFYEASSSSESTDDRRKKSVQSESIQIANNKKSNIITGYGYRNGQYETDSDDSDSDSSDSGDDSDGMPMKVVVKIKPINESEPSTVTSPDVLREISKNLQLKLPLSNNNNPTSKRPNTLSLSGLTASQISANESDREPGSAKSNLLDSSALATPLSLNSSMFDSKKAAQPVKARPLSSSLTNTTSSVSISYDEYDSSKIQSSLALRNLLGTPPPLPPMRPSVKPKHFEQADNDSNRTADEASTASLFASASATPTLEVNLNASDSTKEPDNKENSRDQFAYSIKSNEKSIDPVKKFSLKISDIETMKF
jgi:hypothetical protein